MNKSWGFFSHSHSERQVISITPSFTRHVLYDFSHVKTVWSKQIPLLYHTKYCTRKKQTHVTHCTSPSSWRWLPWNLAPRSLHSPLSPIWNRLRHIWNPGQAPVSVFQAHRLPLATRSETRGILRDYPRCNSVFWFHSNLIGGESWYHSVSWWCICYLCYLD